MKKGHTIIFPIGKGTERIYRKEGKNKYACAERIVGSEYWNGWYDCDATDEQIEEKEKFLEEWS